MKTLCLLLACLVGDWRPLYSQDQGRATFKLLYTFPGGPGGPIDINEALPGVFYGTTGSSFGAIGGTIFSITSEGTLTTVVQFPGGYGPAFAAPVENGQLFGFFDHSGTEPQYLTVDRNGKHLKIHPTGAFSYTLFAFPFGLFAPDAAFYTVMGNYPATEIVKVGIDGEIMLVHSFSGDEGAAVIGAHLARGSDGSFYGINELPNNGGNTAWLYRLTPQGTFTKLATFPSGWVGTSAPIVVAPDGTIYGTLYWGGANLTGLIYKIPPGGTMTNVYTFPLHDMVTPASLFMAGDGNLYGTTHSAVSYFFRVLLPSDKFEVLHKDGGAGMACTCPIIQGSNGKFYGVSPNGGGSGAGTVFELDAGLAPPKPSVGVLSPSSGPVGTHVLLWGTNLLGATSVTFNGTPAAKPLVTSSRSVFVDVPAGGTSGPVTITTPNGAFTVATNFTVQ